MYKILIIPLLILLIGCCNGCYETHTDKEIYERVFDKCVDKSLEYLGDLKKNQAEWRWTLRACEDEAQEIATYYVYPNSPEKNTPIKKTDKSGKSKYE